MSTKELAAINAARAKNQAPAIVNNLATKLAAAWGARK